MWASSVLTYFAAPRAFRRPDRPKLRFLVTMFFFFFVPSRHFFFFYCARRVEQPIVTVS